MVRYPETRIADQARALHIAPKTFEIYLGRLFKKFCVHNRLALVILAIQRGYIRMGHQHSWQTHCASCGLILENDQERERSA